MPRSHMDTKLAELLAKFPDMEVVRFVDEKLNTDKHPVKLLSVEIEEYWADKNIVGEDDIKDYLYANVVSEMGFYDWTEEHMMNKTDEEFERMQFDNVIERVILVKMGVL